MRINFWNKIKEKLNDKPKEGELSKKEIRELQRHSDKRIKSEISGRKKEDKDEEDAFEYANENAQSWNKETHPDGIGDSYIIKKIHYKASTKELIVEYRWGDIAKYKNISKDFVKRFNEADSKGRFAMKYLFNRPFESIDD